MVVGGGNSAGQAAVHLTRFARSVSVVVRRDDLSSTMSAYLIQELDANPRITVYGRAQVVDGGAMTGWSGWSSSTRTTSTASGSRSTGSSCSSAPSRTATGCRRSWPSTSAASCSPGDRCRRSSGSRTCHRRRRQPACPGSSPPGTSGPAA
ncbi:NAD-binding protein [Serinicoccus marinus]|uniref:NAD-binding protein n=1 Tax=Serinicoccus marinus TaxID=247333 RepID=UPI0030B90EEF